MMKKTLIVAQSLDGYIAQSRDQVSTAWTSEEDKRWFGQLTRQMGVMLMGRQTYETIGRPLPERTTVVMTTRKELSPNSIDRLQMVTDADGKRRLEHNLYVTGEKSPAEIMEALAGSGVTQVAICGGARVYREFLETGLVDEMYITIEPVFLFSGIKLFGEIRRCPSPVDPHCTTQYSSESPSSVATEFHPNILIPSERDALKRWHVEERIDLSDQTQVWHLVPKNQ
jgi:dihydrofolate reductase